MNKILSFFCGIASVITFATYATVFLERSAQQAVNVSQPCIGYLELSDSIRSSRQFKQDVEYFLEHPFIKGIVLAINSGGGLATTSWEIFETVKRANTLKPIVAYIDDVCASGAYLTACGTSKIIASTMATIGSIGVVQTIEKLEPTEFKRNGVKGKITVHRFKKGKFKQLGSPYDPMTEEDLVQLEQDLDFLYQKFCTDVADQRNLTVEAVKAQNSLTFTGIQALELGLIDATGSFDDALNALREALTSRGITIPAGTNLKESLFAAE